MKTNQELRFDELARATEDAGRTTTANLSIGRRGAVWRAYCYLWHHEKDIDREGMVAELARRGGTAEEALREIAELAQSRWTAQQSLAVRTCVAQIEDEIAE